MDQETPTSMLLALVIAAALATWLFAALARRIRCGSRVMGPWEAIEIWLSLFLVVGMLLVTATQVAVRYILSDYLSLPWTEELARLLMVWVAMWGAAILQRDDDHIRMTVFVDLLPAPVQRLIDLLGDAVMLIVLGTIAWYGWTSAWQLRIMHTVSLGLPVSIFTLAVAVSATIMIFHSLHNLRRRLLGRMPAPPSAAGEV